MNERASVDNEATSTAGAMGVRMIVWLAIVAVITAALIVWSPDGFYPWAKSFHVISVISWMAGMLYLPRLFVYHVDAPQGSVQSETFKVMERRLLRGIINPAMALSWIFGLWLAWRMFNFQGGWLHAKLALVLILSAMHGYLSASVRAFAQDRNQRTARHWRIINELPAVLMVFIVILVIVKPF